ncbi:hypothetical protein DYU05_18565 [Mucilaginibacter terrenus]|uniref:Uncharacterized protein n=1 Tax=Mucilaginibacter terrenus TaxID=2482727 RepID=A0A3E2NLF3_9SPHI|nr:hypothetical protein [Mucilaginibacter terrenus]RFZ81826.1 hypothetical protein DYU05_18565 [Mucilaginibacter terrenus]
MTEDLLLQGTVKWSYSHELAEFTGEYKRMSAMLSFSPPLHRHSGNIALTTTELIIEGAEGDEDLTLKLSAIKQLYLGFDDIFPAHSVRSRGILWQPLRIEYYTSTLTTECIYLVIDFNGLYTHDKAWYNALRELLE